MGHAIFCIFNKTNVTEVKARDEFHVENQREDSVNTILCCFVQGGDMTCL